MRTKIMISIIVPVFNAAATLSRCLESVTAQTLRDFEIVCVDDGSTDDSGAILQKHAARDSRVRVIRQTNRGVSAARNRGLEAARGEWITFVDADDSVEPPYLSALADALTKSSADMALCGFNKIGPHRVEAVTPAQKVVRIEGSDADAFAALNRRHLLYPSWAKLYRTATIRLRDLRFPEGLSFGEDLIFNLRYLEHARTIATVPAALYNYFAAPSGSLSTAPASRDWSTNFEQWRLIRDFFQRREIACPAAAAFLSDRLWGLAYDTAMSRQISRAALRKTFDRRLTNQLRALPYPSFAVPWWLRAAILSRNHLLLWLIQKLLRTPSGRPAPL